MPVSRIFSTSRLFATYDWNGALQPESLGARLGSYPTPQASVPALFLVELPAASENCSWDRDRIPSP